jgi:hypothetical protein
VAEVEEQPVDLPVVTEALHRGAQRRDPVLVQDLVALDVDRPVRAGGDGTERLVRLDGEDPATLAERVVPDRLQDPHLGRADGADEAERVVVGAADGHHHLVAERQDRLDRLDDRVVVPDGVPDEGEAGDAESAGVLHVRRGAA